MILQEASAQVIASLPSIAGAPQPKDPASFVMYVFLLAFAVSGIAVFTAFLIGAFRYFFAAGNPGAVSDAKDRMLHALMGFFVLAFSIMLLYTINPDLVRLRNPGFPTIVLPKGTAKQPGQCGFTLAQWAGAATPGSVIGMLVTTGDCKDGDAVTFRVLSAAGGQIAQTQGVLAGKSAQATWTIPQQGLGSRFYFEATIGDAKIVSEEFAVDVGPGLIAGDCATIQKGDAAPATCNAPCANTVNPATGQPYGSACTDVIKKAARAWSVPAALVAAVMQRECASGNANCQSAAGACGLMQVKGDFITGSGYPECKPLLGSGVNSATQACNVMLQNPEIAIQVGACILANDREDAIREKSEHNYPSNDILYAAAAYNGGQGANDPSCNCREAAANPPTGCASGASKACLNCATAIPKWLCAYDAPADICTANTGFAETRSYAPSVLNYYSHFAGCAEWQ